MKETIIFLVRHCEVENPKNIVYGSLPGFGLSERGRAQAKDLAAYFIDKKITTVYTSPLKRALETAETISRGDIPIKISPLIKEADYKNWDSLTFKERAKREDYKSYLKNPLGINYLGEGVLDVWTRIQKIFGEVLREKRGQNIVMVSHGVPIVIAKIIFGGGVLTDLGKDYVLNASITKFRFNDKIKIVGIDYKIITPAKKEGP